MTTARVSQIARQSTLRLAETKSPIFTSTRSPSSDFYYASNLIYPITQGTTSESVIGEKMFLKNISIRVLYKSSTSLASPTSLQHIRVAVVKSKKDFTNTHSSITTSDIMRTPLASSPIVDTYDNHKVTVLKQYKRTLTPQTASGSQATFDINVPINSNVTFQSDNAGYLKFGNYYLILHATDGSGVNTTGLFVMSWNVNFKDM